ncbi:MAG TPA: nucleotide exchange factor GrpE [Pyrinomonadaceae bacterium]|nr:nucleotide exchange factor GrpE [Pyrinomonadaceae bacterium]
MPEKKAPSWNRIPIKFSDSEEESEISNRSNPEDFAEVEEELGDPLDEVDPDLSADDRSRGPFVREDDPAFMPPEQRGSGELGGPLVAELVATRAELKRVEGEVADLKDRLARRQADFENYRKRVERERSETYERVVAEIAAKLLPVLDNLKRALDTEASLESGESDEFRHFLSGVDLIFKQLSGVIEALGVKPVSSVGERFDPHIHEAVVSEPTDEHEPDTVMEEIIRGYRLGDKLIRPALVKVATKK